MIKKIYSLKRFNENHLRLEQKAKKEKYFQIDSLHKANYTAFIKAYIQVNKEDFLKYKTLVYKSAQRGVIGKYEIPIRLFNYCIGNLQKVNYDLRSVKVFKDKKQQWKTAYKLKYEYLSNYGYKIAG